MGVARNLRASAAAIAAVGAVFLASCATTGRPQAFRTFFVPPAKPAPAAADDALIEPPNVGIRLYANEVPSPTTTLPKLPKPSDIDFLLKRADDRFLAGKRALQENRPDDARREFNRSLETLLASPENLGDRSRLERRMEELIEAIYRYDVDQLGADDPEDKVTFDKSPLDGILDMTFPVDPSLRSKVKDQIQATVSQLPLEENDAVVGAINFFSTTRGKKILVAGLRRAGRYKSMIERILTEEGVPQELIFVAQAESGFLPRAMSNKACVGLWQFAQFRGKEYGLMQTPATDDRMDPEKATRAAAHHLHDLYTHFGDWYLALGAYNCGPGCVDRAVTRTGFADFWSLRRLNALPKETSNYVPVILAMTIMSKNAKDYGIENLDLDPAMSFDTVELQTPTHLALVADAVERPVSALRELNPGLLRLTAPAGYALHVPKGTLDEVESAFAIVPANRRDSWRLHRVEGGDTLATLAKRYSTASANISAANHDDLPSAGGLVAIPVSYPGDRVVRPASTSRRSRSASASAPAKTVAKNKPAATAAAPKKSASAAHKPTGKRTVHRTAGTGTPAS